MSRPDTVTLRGDEVRTFPAVQLRATTATIERDAGEVALFTEIEGLAVPYGEWTDTGWEYEQFAPGAFAKSIAENTLPLLMWHDNRTWPVGRAEEWTETAEGLVGRWSLDDSEEAQRGADLAQKGMLTGMSIGFVPSRREGANEWVDIETGEPIDDLWDRNAGVIRKEARLVEVSLTPTPAYAGAQVALVRSAARREAQGRRHESEELNGWRRYVESIKR